MQTNSHKKNETHRKINWNGIHRLDHILIIPIILQRKNNHLFYIVHKLSDIVYYIYVYIYNTYIYIYTGRMGISYETWESKQLGHDLGTTSWDIVTIPKGPFRGGLWTVAKSCTNSLGWLEPYKYLINTGILGGSSHGSCWWVKVG